MAKKQRRQKGDKGEASTRNGGSCDIEVLSLSYSIVTEGSENADCFFSADGWAGDNDEFDQADDGVTGVSEERERKIQDAFAAAEDYCSEKRSTRRENILRQWYTALTHCRSGSSETVECKLPGIIKCCQFSVRSGSPSEQYAACRVVETIAVLFADESLYEQTYRTLLLTTRSKHRAIPVRIAALRAIGMTVYIGIDDGDIVREVMNLCEAVARSEYRGEKVAPGLRAAALTVWNVLATTLHEFYIAGADDVSTGRGLGLLPILVECLEQEDDLDLQSAAGECAAWIHSARLQLGVEDGDCDNTTERRYRLGSWEGSKWEDTMSEIEALMECLSNQSGHLLSKRKKKETRTIFRELLSTIQENEPPLQVLQFRGGTLELTSWKSVIPMSFIRRCLQDGLQMQLMTNPTLQAIFGVNAEVLNSSQRAMSQKEKRLLFSKASVNAKEKDRNRTRKRQSRTNAKNLFLTNDD
ncbi:MAG: hypothetical protein SGBAC_001115 [Bacillariaceae sp.]